MATSWLHTSHDAAQVDVDDLVRFVVQDGAYTLHFSKRRLMCYTPFFKEYFTAHAAALSNSTKSNISKNNTVVLKHVTGAAAEAALRLCHSKLHCDDGPFQALQTAYAAATTAEQRRDALRNLLSLYEACMKFELWWHARLVSDAVTAAVTPSTVLDVLKTCARYTSVLPVEVRAKVGLRSLLTACRLCTPEVWARGRDERRWRRLCTQYPELPAMLEAATATSDTTAAAVVERRGAPHVLSPQKDEAVEMVAVAASDSHDESDEVTKSVSADPTSLEDIFAHHLRQTEALALAAQRRRSEMEGDVAALHASSNALRARTRNAERAVMESTRYLKDGRVYVQALRAAEKEMQALYTEIASKPAASGASSTMHVLRHQLEHALETAIEKRNSVEAMIAIEEDALRSLDDELQILQRPA